MATIQKSIAIMFKPLRCSCAIEAVGPVPAKQTYQGDKREFTPDYTLTPLTLYPRCNAINQDNDELIDGINTALTNVRWYEIIGGKERLIGLSEQDYDITITGDEKGKIVIRRNSSTISPVTLKFSAEYTDFRTGHVYKFGKSIIIVCSDATSAIPALSLDCPPVVIYNPLRDACPDFTASAKVIVGDIDVTKGCTFSWSRVNKITGELTPITSDDLEIVDKNNLTVDRDIIQESSYVCEAVYRSDEYCEPIRMSSSVTFRRCVGKIEGNWEGAPDIVSDSSVIIKPKAIISDQNGIIPGDGEGNLKLCWFVKRSRYSGFVAVGEGQYPEIPFTDGMIIRLDVEDIGSNAVVSNAGGEIITSGDSIVVSR